MNRRQPDAYLLSVVHLDREAQRPLYRQLYAGLRQAILEGQLAPGTRLPSSRDLADLLDVSRNTVVNAFEQLLAEGYLRARVGSGTYVTERLPEAYLNAYQGSDPAPAQDSPRTLSQRGAAFAGHYRPGARGEVHPVFPQGLPDLQAFPFDVWARLASRRLKETDPATLGYARGRGGVRALQQAIAGHLRAARAVRCDPEQIVVVAGSQQGLYLAAQVLLDAGDAVWMEEPGYGGARAAFQCAEARLLPGPVDEEGLDVEAVRHDGTARVAYVTPSHQFPLGHTMSLARRTRLLQWATDHDGWIIEDDYDSEFRYSGAPLASLQGLDVNGRVIYAGTFSKTLFPGLRLGYLLVPPDLAGAFLVARGATSLSPPVVEQLVLADFMAQGHFARHIRRMRTRYAQRRRALVQAVEAEAGTCLQLEGGDAGLHVTAWLPPGVDEEAVQARAAARGVTVMPLSRLYLRPARAPAPGLVLGFAAAPVEEIRPGVKRLARAIEYVRKGR